MSELLYQRCPMCSGTLSLPEPAALNTGGTTTDCPCRRSKTPGWCAIGLTLGQVDGLVKRRAEGDRFKAFVHRYLTEHGVPEGDPENPHQKEWCRIGARLDLLLSERDRLREAVGQKAVTPPDPVCVCGHPKSGHVPATPTQLVCIGPNCGCLEYEPEPEDDDGLPGGESS